MQSQNVMYGNVTSPITRARRTLMWSRVFLYVGAASGLITGLGLLVAALASLGQDGGGSAGTIGLSLLWLVGGTAFFAYDLWANYWGWIWVWRTFLRPRSLAAFVALTVLTAGLPLLIASFGAGLYGFFGGAIYQYHQAKQNVAADDAAAAAIPIALRAVNTNPNDAQAWVALATAYWTRRNFDQALNAIDRAIQLNQRDVALLVLKGGILRNAFAFSRNVSHLDAALVAFNQALAIDPSSWQAQQARNESLAVRNSGIR